AEGKPTDMRRVRPRRTQTKSCRFEAPQRGAPSAGAARMSVATSGQTRPHFAARATVLRRRSLPAAPAPRPIVAVTPPRPSVEPGSAPGIGAVVRSVAWPPPAPIRSADPNHLLNVGGRLRCRVRQSTDRHGRGLPRLQGNTAQGDDA